MNILGLKPKGSNLVQRRGLLPPFKTTTSSDPSLLSHFFTIFSSFGVIFNDDCSAENRKKPDDDRDKKVYQIG